MHYWKPLFLLLILISLYGCGGGDSASSSSSSSGSSSSSSASSSGSPTGNVCPANKPCAIMAFGDGVMEGLEPVGTGGYANNGGFRPALLEMAVADGKSITFVGVRENGPSSTEHPLANLRKHSGFSAIRLEDLVLMVPDPIRRFPADIVLIHAGTHEVASTGFDNIGPQSFSKEMQLLQSVMQRFYSLNRSGLLVVSNFAGLRHGDPRSIAIGSAIERAVADFKRQNPAAQVVLADHLARGITRGHDNLMPNAAGYHAMAEVWYQAIQPYLK
ncbi:hypothetical protein [Saccharophagus sp. K07]|jgi:hypothetical protein|uniref:hypothetical protein n=1 Tax=Saccharophagus sp. K07 TaxID=2283636 RepID=UPI00165243A2|nr:hypothetical protein [Saccharophagus sp. K07]